MNRSFIEESLPLIAVNAQSAREKSLRHGHISTMHLWWARRPLSMSRAIVFGSLLPDPTDEPERDRLMALLGDFSAFEKSTEAERVLGAELQRAWPAGPPRVLDCFAGGGAIPLEAVRLGCETVAVDVNPVAHLIQRGVLEFPMTANFRDGISGNSLTKEFRRWADWIGARAEDQLSEWYPPFDGMFRPAVYLWARTVTCADAGCGRQVPMIRTRRVMDAVVKQRIDFEVTDTEVQLRLREGMPTDGSDWRVGTVKASSVTCPACGTTRPASEVRRFGKQHGFGQVLYGVIEVPADGRTRRYREPFSGEQATALAAATAVAALPDYPEGTSAVPDEQMVMSQARCLRNITFGITSWAGLFTQRQLLCLATLARLVREAHHEMLSEGLASEVATAVTTYLAFCVDRVADYNSSFCSWHVNEKAITHTFPQQSIRMAWDFTEISPFAGASGGWQSASEWIEKAIDHCAQIQGSPGKVMRGNAQQLDLDDESFDAVIVDPPYYDAFQYGDLSDFFYVWLKRSLGELYPELFHTPLTPKQAEVIENRAEKRSPEHISHEEFESRLQNALREIARVLRPSGVVSLVFAHTDVEAWERLLRALRAAGLVVTTSWPMRSEMATRTTAQVSAVLGSSVVLVCRKAQAAGEGFYDDVVRELEARIAERLGTFEEMRLIGADYFVSAIGPAFEVFARYSRVVRLSGEEVGVDELMVLARQAVARHAIRRLLGGENLAALDGRSLLYLTWRWAYDGEAIPADEAYKLGRAFDIDLADLARPRDLIAKTGDSFQLLAPHERKNPKLTTTPSMIDVMHLAAQFHDAGRRNELAELLGATGMGSEPGFWATATAIAESLPDGNRERTMLLGLTGNKDQLAQAAAKHVSTSVEELTLFGNS